MISKSFRIMLSILNSDPTFSMEHWDVRMAFTQAPLQEEIYMEQPDGFEVDKAGSVLKLRKSLYGLKQSAHNWQQMLNGIFKNQGFRQLSQTADPCVHVKFVGKAWVMLSTHVDDIFVLCNEPGLKLKNDLFLAISNAVEIENMGQVSWALKTQILRDKKNGVLKISQERYTTEIVQKHFPHFLTQGSEKRKNATPYYQKQNSNNDNLNEKLKPMLQAQIGVVVACSNLKA